jgi:hypothetical protein
MYVARLICCVRVSWLRAACAIGLRERCDGRGGIIPQHRVCPIACFRMRWEDASCTFPFRKGYGELREKQIDDLIYARDRYWARSKVWVLGGFSPPPLDDHGPCNGRVEQGVPGGSKKKFLQKLVDVYTQPWQLSS